MKKSAIARWSLLSVIGLIPLACTDSEDDEPGNANVAGEAGDGAGAKGGTAGTGGTAVAAGEGGGGDSGGTGPKLPTCTSPQLDAVTGLTSCAEGYHYRGHAVECSKRAGDVTSGVGGEGSGGSGGDGGGAGRAGDNAGGLGGTGSEDPIAPPQCSPACADSEFCRVISATPYATACATGCLTDDECGDDQLCACDGARGGVCVEAGCRADSDCSTGYHCAQAEGCLSSGGPFLCQSPADECLTRDDCDDVMCGVDLASKDHRVCYDGIACGG